MGNSRIKYTTIKSPKKPNFEPTQTETTPPINLELKRAKWVPGNSAIQGLWGLWWGSCIGGWWLWWWGVELRGFDEREGLREGLGRIEERRWGWLWLWALNNFLVRWYLYHCWGRGALVPLVLVLLWVLLTFLFLILHFFFFFCFSDCCRETQRVVVFIRLGLGLSMAMISFLTEIQPIMFGLYSTHFICCSTF